MDITTPLTRAWLIDHRARRSSWLHTFRALPIASQQAFAVAATVENGWLLLAHEPVRRYAAAQHLRQPRILQAEFITFVLRPCTLVYSARIYLVQEGSSEQQQTSQWVEVQVEFDENGICSFSDIRYRP